MDENLEQRACIKFCVANGFKCSETLKMLEKAFGESCLGKTQAYEWYKRFKGGRTSLDHDEIPGRPTTSVTEENIESAKQIVLQNRSVPIREIAVLLGISYGSAEHILTDVLGLKRVASRLVPKKLNFIQKQRWLCRSFWPKTQPISSTKHRTLQIWPRVTFSSSPDSNCHCGERVLRP